MRLLIVTGIFPPDHGGPASYVPIIAEHLSRRHEVRAVVTLSDVAGDGDARYPFPVIRIPRALPRAQRLLRTIALIAKLARDVDVVYLNGLVLEGILACRFLQRRPVAVKVVGDLIWEKARNAGATATTLDDFQMAALPMKWRWLRRLQGWYLAHAQRVITPSRYLAGIVQGWGVGPGRISVVYNAVELPRPPSGPARARAVDVVTVARLVPWKGVRELIELCREHGWSLDIVGDGPLRSELEALAAGCPGIRFVGHLPHDEVADAIRRARVFVLNSSYEGLPHIVLEAQAAGTPVIATAVGGTPEAIDNGRNGLLVPAGDRIALADAIKSVLGDEGVRATLAAAEGGRKQFELGTMLTETEAVLSAMAERPISGARG